MQIVLHVASYIVFHVFYLINLFYRHWQWILWFSAETDKQTERDQNQVYWLFKYHKLGGSDGWKEGREEEGWGVEAERGLRMEGWVDCWVKQQEKEEEWKEGKLNDEGGKVRKDGGTK